MVIHVSGEVDIVAAPTLRHCIDEQLGKVRSLVLDLTGTSFFGAAGLSVLVHTADRARQHEVSWALICPHAVLRPLTVTGLSEGLPVCVDLPEAIAAVTTEQAALSGS
ncbi:STAS domain-containing protein [Saccharomonospora amisosensis]|uniref:STAS domain-containing protein n=1 Tax=Saccharomonospora amisosensis TaxID=1128677 RepID=UPI0028BE9A14|nr:STAS domain-containing protein [Saccharomonospora amisosensis]